MEQRRRRLKETRYLRLQAYADHHQARRRSALKPAWLRLVRPVLQRQK